MVMVSTYGLLTKHEIKMAGYWPSSFFAFLWTETKSRSIKTQKKNIIKRRLLKHQKKRSVILQDQARNPEREV